MPRQNPALDPDRRAAYEAYIGSAEWQALRLQALERDGNACRVCNSTKRLDVHHRTYERFGAEDLNDLTVLCRACHDTHHRNQGIPKKKRRSGLSRDEKRPAVAQAIMQMEPGRVYTTKQIVVLSGISAPTVVLQDFVDEGQLHRVSKRQWSLPYSLPPARATDRLRQLPAQLAERAITQRGAGRPTSLDKFALRAEQDRKTRAEKRGPTSTG